MSNSDTEGTFDDVYYMETKPRYISTKLAHFLQIPPGSKASFVDVLDAICKYIVTNNLQQPDRKCNFIIDDALSLILDKSKAGHTHVFTIDECETRTCTKCGQFKNVGLKGSVGQIYTIMSMVNHNFIHDISDELAYFLRVPPGSQVSAESIKSAIREHVETNNLKSPRDKWGEFIVDDVLGIILNKSNGDIVRYDMLQISHNFMHNVSSELAHFLRVPPGSRVSLGDIHSAVCKYIDRHNLKSPDECYFVVDDILSLILNRPKNDVVHNDMMFFRL